MPLHYINLLAAVILETIGTLAMQASLQFTKPIPVLILIVSYGLSFYFMALVLKVMPVGLVYAIWSGTGIVLIAIAGYFMFNQKLDFAAIVGMALIVAGVLVINLFSGSTTH